MENTASKSENTILRQKVEELLKKKHLQPGTQLSACETNTLLHEMEVNQIELEMQNEELKLARYATQDAIELYDFAPSAFFTLNRTGEIVTINLSGAKMLGMEPTCLKNYSIDLFISEETKTIFNHFLRKLFNSKTKEYCEIIFSVNGNLPVNIYLSGIIKENNEECLITAIDITDIKKAAKEIELASKCCIKRSNKNWK